MCILEEGDCPEACEGVVKKAEDKKQDETKDDEEVKSGNIEVTVERESSERNIPGVGTIVVDPVKFSASEEVTVRSVDVKIAGLTNQSSVDSIWFERDGVQVSTVKRMNSDKVTVSFKNGWLTVKKNETLDFVVSLEGGDAGAIVEFEIVDIDSTAKSPKIREGRTTTLRTSKYNVAAFTFNWTTGNDTTYEMSSNFFDFGEFDIENTSTTKDNKTLVVKSITLKNNWTANTEDLTDYQIVRDGKVVSKSYSIDGKTVTIAMNDEIDAKVTATYYLQAKINEIERENSTYQFVVKSNTDIIIDEANGFRSTNTGTFNSELSTYTVKGGEFTIVSNTEKTSVDTTAEQEVVVAEWVIKANEEATIEDSDDTGAPRSRKVSFHIAGDFRNVQDMWLSVNGAKKVLEMDEAKTKAGLEEEITLKKGENTVKLVVKTVKSAELTGNKDVTFTDKSITSSNFYSKGEYASNNEQFDFHATAGSIKVAKVNIKNAEIYIKKVYFDPVRLVANGSSLNTTVFSGKIVNDSDLDVRLTEVVMTGNGDNLVGNDNILIALYVDGDSVSSSDRKIKNGSTTVKFNRFSNVIIPAHDSKDIEVAVDTYTINETMLGATDKKSITLSMEITTKEGNNTATGSVSTLGTIELMPAAKVTTSDSANLSNKTIQKNSIVKVAEAKMDVKYAGVVVTGMAITGSDLSGEIISSMEVEYFKKDGSSYRSMGTFEIGNKAGQKTDTEWKGDKSISLDEGTYTFVINAQIVNKDITSPVSFTVNGVEFYFDEEPSTWSIKSYSSEVTYRVVNVVPTISKVSSTTDSMTIQLMKKSSTDDDFTVTGFTIKNNSSTGNVAVSIKKGQTVLWSGSANAWDDIVINFANKVLVSDKEQFTISIDRGAEAKQVKLTLKEITYDGGSLTEEDWLKSDGTSDYVITYNN